MYYYFYFTHEKTEFREVNNFPKVIELARNNNKKERQSVSCPSDRLISQKGSYESLCSTKRGVLLIRYVGDIKPEVKSNKSYNAHSKLKKQIQSQQDEIIIKMDVVA